MKQLLNIGSSKEAVVAARIAVMDILKLNKSESVTIKALDVFQHVTGVDHTIVQNCVFNAEGLGKKR